MDSIISLGSKVIILHEYMISRVVQSIHRMLERTCMSLGQRTKKYVELSAAEKIQADCDMKATNIILQGLPANIYSLVNHHRVAKDLWERVHLLMQIFDKARKRVSVLCVGETKIKIHLHLLAISEDDTLSLQHLTSLLTKIYSTFNNSFHITHGYTFKPNQTLLHIFNPSQTQINHLSIPPAHTFQSQMNLQTSTVPQVIPQVAYQLPQAPTQLMTESPFVDLGFVVLVFSPGDDLIACLNKAMAFLTAVASSRFPSTNNQLRTSSNPRNQATIQDGRVTVQQVQGGQGQNYSGTTYKSNATSLRGNTISGQARVVKCYNCQGEGCMARQCTQPKRPSNAAWYKEKAMLAEAQEARQILDEEQLTFLADPGILASQAQTIIPHNAAFQTKDLDTYDSNCDDLSTAQAVLMANISNYGSDVISDVPNSETYLNDMDNQSVHAL
ncbi:hypothetical protein Tco_0319813 [Tanacetum coccineum]